MQESWTIAELAELAAETLAATDPAGPPSGPARADGRIRDVPNERLVRWYATVGLVDPPLSRRGRVARYGRRHLLQLVAVKRRQAAGRSPVCRTSSQHRSLRNRPRPASGRASPPSSLPTQTTPGSLRPVPTRLY